MAYDNETRATIPRKANTVMSPFNNNNDDEEDTTFDEVSSMADRLGLKGKARAAYIDDHMQGLGYVGIQSRESYVRPTREDDPEAGGFGARWGIGRGGSGGGQSGGPRSRPGQDRDDPDRY